MYTALHALGEILAVAPLPTPHPTATTAPPRTMTLTIGRAGEWVGPLMVGVLAGLLDRSAVGPSALRDRLAVPGYYACTIAMAAIVGWTSYIRGAVGNDYNWQMIGATASVLAHGALVFAMFGGLIGAAKPLAKDIAKRIKFNSAASDAAAINQTLLGWSVAAGLLAPLSGDGPFGRLVDLIAVATTGIWSQLVNAYLYFIGG